MTEAKTDPAEGRRLLRDYEAHMSAYRNAMEYTHPADDAPLRMWLWENRAALIDATLNLEGARLQIESRDRAIIELLDTLAKAEGITAPPRKL